MQFLSSSSESFGAKKKEEEKTVLAEEMTFFYLPCLERPYVDTQFVVVPHRIKQLDIRFIFLLVQGQSMSWALQFANLHNSL